MGLPLWQPRVESDIPSRPEAKNPAHVARSRIRGSSTRDRGTTLRERPSSTRLRHALQDPARRLAYVRELQDRQTEQNSITIRRPAPAQAPPPQQVTVPFGAIRRLILRLPTDRVPESMRRLAELEEEVQEQQEREEQMVERDALVTNAIEELARRRGAPPLSSADRHERFEQLGNELALLEQERVASSMAALSQTRRHEAIRLVRESQGQPADNEPAATTPPPVPYQAYHPYPRERVRLPADRPSLFAREASTFTETEAAIHNRGPPRVDGLGDRDRSLSPEGDNAWDTLLTTLTPDPQPPSVGSSFASARSAAASRSAANESAATSFTAPESRAEQLSLGVDFVDCDSDEDDNMVNFARDMDMDDDTNAPGQDASSAPGNSYADVVRLGEYTMPGGVRTRNPPVSSGLRRQVLRDGTPVWSYERDAEGNGEDTGGGNAGRQPATEDLIMRLVGGLGGMQHIVRNLVRREDIPNDWWVDAGLSRTLPRDGNGDSGENENDDNGN